MGDWGVRLLVALVLVSAAGARAFGATLPPPADRVCSLTQITHTGPPAANIGPEINAAGTRIAFRSSADLTGENPDGNAEIFLATCGAHGKEGEERSDLLSE